MLAPDYEDRCMPLTKSPAGVLELVALLSRLAFSRLTGAIGLALAWLVADEESSAPATAAMLHRSAQVASTWSQLWSWQLRKQVWWLPYLGRHSKQAI